MRRAIELARAAVREGTGGPFGAVVTRDGEIVGEGQNRVLETNDPTAHAEVVALRAAARKLGSPHLQGCVLYASCEPCPLCLAAALWARVDEVWHSASRRDAAAAGFDDALFYEELVRPERERRLRVRTFLPGAADATFAEWLRSPDRRGY